MTTIDHLREQITSWIYDDPDPRTSAELRDLLQAANDGDGDASAELADRFSGLLQFGTAGLRGALGGGPARMNRAVVSRAAAGLGAFLSGALPDAAPVVVIGFDARHGSAEFATDSAEILSGMGAKVMLFDQTCPTPVLAYAVRHLGADAGVMVTASHNPPEDNGYKVYLGGRVVTGPGQGAQIVDPYDAHIAEQIAAVPSVSGMVRSSDYETVGADLIASYTADTLALAPNANPFPGLKIVYTPMHGVGGATMVDVLTRAGFEAITKVEEQWEPDPQFPTVAFPNPEEAGALDLAISTAQSVDADVIIANDPDADRVSIAVPTDDGWRQLTGDEIGALLGHMLAGAGIGGSAPGGVFANSVVSSRLLGAIAKEHGITHLETLTGFKWISRAPGLTYGYEEAIGYCVAPGQVRDKDGISAGLMLAVLSAQTVAADRRLTDILDDIALRHGLYASGALSARVQDLEQIPQMMARLRQTPPTSLAGSPVHTTQDLLHPADDLPPTDALIYVTESNDRVIVRPSGTEPKVKCYLEVVQPVADRAGLPAAKTHAAHRLEALSADIATAAGFTR